MPKYNSQLYSYSSYIAANYRAILRHRKSANLYLPVRHAGHAKWQNIAATKSANDQQHAKVCCRYANMIVMAIKQNKNDSDPKYNSELARVIADAQSENVPKSTVENAIKRAKSVDVAMVASMSEIRGPGNTFIIVETFAKSRAMAELEIKNVMKKAKAGMLDKGLLNLFERRGVILAKPLNLDVNLDNAEEDAIECGAEEIQELDVPVDEGKVFEFLCDPMDFTVVKNKLEAKSPEGGAGYDIISASIQYIPSGQYIDLISQKEEEAFRKLVTMLEDNELVTGVYHNCTLDTSH